MISLQPRVSVWISPEMEPHLLPGVPIPTVEMAIKQTNTLAENELGLLAGTAQIDKYGAIHMWFSSPNRVIPGREGCKIAIP